MSYYKKAFDLFCQALAYIAMLVIVGMLLDSCL